MSSLRSLLALLCCLLMVAPLAPAQQNVKFERGPVASDAWWISRPYRQPSIGAINLANSNRLEALLRAGKLYLSLQDAIALALENNLDIELQRYGPELARADLKRAEAGGVIRGVPVSVTQGAQSAVSLVTGGFGGGTGGTGTGGSASSGQGGAQSGTLFQVTGTAIPNLDPTLTTSFTRSKSSNPQTNSFVTGLTSLQVESNAFNVSLAKEYLTGTGVTFGYNSSNINTNSPNNDLNPFNRGAANLQVRQRLLQGFGKAVNNRNIRISKNNLKVSDLVFKQQVINIVSSVINLYWDLVSVNAQLKVRQQAVQLAQKLYEDNKKQVEIGTLAPIEIVRAEAEVARTMNELVTTETNVLQQETIIKNQLSKNGIASPTVAEARIIPTDTIKFADKEDIAALAEMMDTALKNRPELEQTRISIENTKIGLQGAKSQLLPSFDIFGSLTNNGLAGDPNPLRPPTAPPNFVRQVDPFFVGGYGTMFGQIVRRNFPDYAVGFQLNVPLRNRAAQADLTNDTLRLRQQELQEQRQVNGVRVEVQNAIIAVNQARARYNSALKTRELQRETLSAEEKKLSLGSSTIFLVIQAQRDLQEAESQVVVALAVYSRAKVSLDVALGNLLSTYSVSLEEAMQGQVAKGPSPIPN
ncbi:MAG: TolC family protein [Bryobacter sp.]|nr:TolC family protein [Bryobacter sp.]